MPTLWVQATRTDRKVIVSEADEQHPTPNHEIFIVGYPDPRYDADGKQIEANPPIEVGDTALVRQRIADGDLRLVSAPPARPSDAESERQAAVQREQELAAAEAERTEQERLEAERQAAANKGKAK